MKTLLILIATLCVISASMPAAPPVVMITDLNHVSVNGLPSGTVVDAITNAPDCAAQVLDWLNARDKETAAAQSAKLSEAQNRAVIAEQKASTLEGQIALKLNEELATGEGPKAKLLRELLAEAQRPAREREAERIESEIAALQKQLEQLRAASAESAASAEKAEKAEK